jgi:predicted DCC family thiol-disulfide oxidoreductase YuxK
MQAEYPVIIFDGVCNLCNKTVQTILKHDSKGIFRFTALQNNTAKEILKSFKNEKISDSVLLIENGKLFQQSAAALRIARKLKYYKLLYFLIVIPAPVRDFFYKLIANNRYRWFGKKDTCMIPEKKWAERFI